MYERKPQGNIRNWETGLMRGSKWEGFYWRCCNAKSTVYNEKEKNPTT